MASAAKWLHFARFIKVDASWRACAVHRHVKQLEQQGTALGFTCSRLLAQA
jgi:hypothetical protein